MMITFDEELAQIPTEQMLYIKKRVQIASEVRKVLEELGWTQRKLAERAGFQESYVSRILQGDNLTLETIAKLEAALGCELMVVPRFYAREKKAIRKDKPKAQRATLKKTKRLTKKAA